VPPAPLEEIQQILSERASVPVIPQSISGRFAPMMLCFEERIMSMTRDEAINRLKKSEDELKRAGVTHLYLFGSTARNEARPDSDVDLFFDYERGTMGLFELMDIKELAANILGTKTDMIPRRGLHRMLEKPVEASALQIF
jgi:predicted nucleotidyltransferase